MLREEGVPLARVLVPLLLAVLGIAGEDASPIFVDPSSGLAAVALDGERPFRSADLEPGGTWRLLFGRERPEVSVRVRPATGDGLPVLDAFVDTRDPFTGKEIRVSQEHGAQGTVQGTTWRVTTVRWKDGGSRPLTFLVLRREDQVLVLDGRDHDLVASEAVRDWAIARLADLRPEPERTVHPTTGVSYPQALAGRERTEGTVADGGRRLYLGFGRGNRWLQLVARPLTEEERAAGDVPAVLALAARHVFDDLSSMGTFQSSEPTLAASWHEERVLDGSHFHWVVVKGLPLRSMVRGVGDPVPPDLHVLLTTRGGTSLRLESRDPKPLKDEALRRELVALLPSAE